MRRGVVSIASLVFVVMSHGHGPRMSSEPYISGDSFRAFADHLFDETDKSFDPDAVKNGDIIFVKTDYLADFFNTKHIAIRMPYILITHNSDYGAPGLFEKYLNDPMILMWFGQNPTCSGHPKFIPIPIGIANQYWSHGNINTFNRSIKKANTIQDKPYLLGINFRPGTHRVVREPIYTYFSVQPYCHTISSSDHQRYLINMAHASFVLSPEGNGLDTHRTWEILLMGSIPIVKHSALDPLFQDLPVLLVDDWKEVTLDYLSTVYEELNNRTYRMEKIWFDYWKRLICSYKKV